MAEAPQNIEDAKLQPLPGSMLREQFQNVLGRSSTVCDAEWGERADDGALVFHFFPPGYAAGQAVDWPDWTTFRDALERAAIKYFKLEHISADYVRELQSFYLIVKPPPAAIDLVDLIEKFFETLEAPSA